MTRGGAVLAATMLVWAGDQAQALPQTVPQNPRICVLDQQEILSRSTIALRMAAQFQQIRQQAQTNFEQERQALEAEEQGLESQSGSLSPAVLSQQRNALSQRRAQLTARGEQINQHLGQLDTELTSNVARLTAPTVRAVETEKGCSLLIARASLLNLDDLSLDITSAVIERLNATP